jgi:integrase
MKEFRVSKCEDLGEHEVARFLQAVDGLRNRVALATTYAAGLRVGEVVRLKVASIKLDVPTRHLSDARSGNQALSDNLRLFRGRPSTSLGTGNRHILRHLRPRSIHGVHKLTRRG